MTVAPGTTALVGSVTAPVMVADRIWPNAADAQASVSRSTSEQRQRFSDTETFLPDGGRQPASPSLTGNCRERRREPLPHEAGNGIAPGETSGRILYVYVVQNPVKNYRLS